MKLHKWWIATTLLLSFIVIAMVSCAAGQAESAGTKPMKSDLGLPSEFPEEVGELLHRYEKAIQTHDPELLGSIMDPDTLLRYTERNGHMTDIRGLDAISEFRLDFFNGFGPPEDFRLGTIRRHEGNVEDRHLAVNFMFEESGGDEWIMVRNISGPWMIHIIETRFFPPGEWVTNRYQATTDYDRNGFLDGDERQELAMFTLDFYQRGPHKVDHPVDEFFDVNGDGFIDEREIGRAADIHFLQGPRFWREMFPWEEGSGPSPHGDLDLNGDGTVTDEDLMEARNGMAERFLHGDWPERLSHMCTVALYPDAVYQPVPRKISNILDEMGDRDGDGTIEIEEQSMILESLLPAYKDARNSLERAIDENNDGKVDGNDVFLAMQAAALGRGMVAQGAEPPYTVQTSVDELLDANRDGLVDSGEIELTVSAFSGNLGIVGELRRDLGQAFDWNDDGRVEPWEIEEAKALFIMPRPVNPDEALDRDLDVNGDGFIDPNELGITAGVTDKGEIPSFEERIAMMRKRGSEGPGNEPSTVDNTSGDTMRTDPARGSEYYRKLGTIQDKKLAVVSLDIGTDKVDEETAGGVIVFVENAFVNVGKVSVVDRANIEEIFKEVAFQSTGVIDESTAVEIGKLSGADIIVIGSINRVGGVFYLNIKLIEVETGEIIGSSIAQAPDAMGFLEMANQAVYKLF